MERKKWERERKEETESRGVWAIKPTLTNVKHQKFLYFNWSQRDKEKGSSIYILLSFSSLLISNFLFYFFGGFVYIVCTCRILVYVGW